MRRTTGGAIAVLAAAVLLTTALAERTPAQAKKLVYWTHWEQNPEFNRWYETKGKEFARKSGYEVEVVTIPYQGYEAKYLAALMGKTGAPDFFNGIAHQWCGQYDFCDRMPPDLEKRSEEHTSELQSQSNLVCRLLLEKKKNQARQHIVCSK